MGGRTLALAITRGCVHRMKITVLVKPNAKRDQVTLDENGVYTVKVAVPPIEGKANTRLIELLADHFDKPKSSIQILTGLNARHKIVEIG